MKHHYPPPEMPQDPTHTLTPVYKEHPTHMARALQDSADVLGRVGEAVERLSSILIRLRGDVPVANDVNRCEKRSMDIPMFERLHENHHDTSAAVVELHDLLHDLDNLF